MTHPVLPIGLILDHTALIAYDALLMAPGETIREVWLDGRAVGLPAWCLAAAIGEGVDVDVIAGLLWEETGVRQLHLDARIVGYRARDFGGSLPYAAAAVAADENDAPVLTTVPEIYRKAGVMAVPLD